MPDEPGRIWIFCWSDDSVWSQFYSLFYFIDYYSRGCLICAVVLLPLRTAVPTAWIWSTPASVIFILVGEKERPVTNEIAAAVALA